MKYVAKRGQVSYGESIGILMLDTFCPFIPGDVGNATTYTFPVRYKTIPGFTVQRIFDKDVSALEQFLEAGEELVKEGVKAITGDCGFMALFQQQLVDSLQIPVFLTSLLQVPFISSIIGSKNSVGIITANAKALDRSLLLSAGIGPNISVRIAGLEGKQNFWDAAVVETGILDRDEVEREVVETAIQLVTEHPDVRAILLECSMLPPYANAVHRAVGLPVFDFVTMINYVHASLQPKRYEGTM